MEGYLEMDPSHHTLITKPSITWTLPALLGTFSFSLLLIGCQRVDNYFTVHSPSGEIASAELQLCQKNQLLVQDGLTFKGQMAINCEGAGKIVVRLKNGRETNCPVGYVTPGMETTFEYVIKGGVCE